MWVSVTRPFSEIVEFFNENLGKIEEKDKMVLKSENSYKKTIYLTFITKYYESKFENFQNCGKSGHTSGGLMMLCWQQSPSLSRGSS